LEAKGSIEVKCAFYFKVIESKKIIINSIVRRFVVKMDPVSRD